MNPYVFDNNFFFITGVIRKIQSRRLNSHVLNNLMSSKKISDIKMILKETMYEKLIADGDSFDEFIKNLVLWEKWLYEFIEKFSYIDELNKLLRIEYDYHNIKTLYKEKINGQIKGDFLNELGIIDKDEILEIMNCEKFDKLSIFIQEAIEEVNSICEENDETIEIDLVFDRKLFCELLFLSKSLHSKYIENYYKNFIDLVNVKVFSRINNLKKLKKYMDKIFIPGGFINISIYADSTNKISLLYDELRDRKMHKIIFALKNLNINPFDLERTIDFYLLNYLSDADFLICGLSPLFAYAQNFKIDLKIIKMILCGINTGVNINLLKSIIPEYV